MDVNKDGLEKFVGKKVYVELKSSRHYSGKVISIDHPDSLIRFMNLFDVKDRPVCFPVSEIKLIQEEQ